jgi:large subunit ribosomal protein L3
MPRRIHHPRRGSMAYSPRVKARSEVTHIKSWPDDGEKVKIQGFAGYKAGMTHGLVVDYRPTSTTSGQEVMIPITVVETPPMEVAAVRYYASTVYGLKTINEVWKNSKKVSNDDISDVRILVYAQPALVTSVPKKKKELMEIRIGGGEIEERRDYAESLIGREITINDFAKDGQMIDVIGVTKGKGFQGHVKRWGVKLLSHKNSKHRRMIGTAGPTYPSFIRPTVPQAGQMGYHQRTEYNKRILKVGDSAEEINPMGGFVNYGLIKNSYVLLHGSVPGPAKRLIRFRDSVRYIAGVAIEKPNIVYVSLASKQGAGR